MNFYMNVDFIEGRILYKFLKERGAFERYIYNVNQEGHKLTSKRDILSFMSDYLISAAFSWSNTPEGDRYWRILHDEFRMKY